MSIFSICQIFFNMSIFFNLSWLAFTERASRQLEMVGFGFQILIFTSFEASVDQMQAGDQSLWTSYEPRCTIKISTVWREFLNHLTQPVNLDSESWLFSMVFLCTVLFKAVGCPALVHQIYGKLKFRLPKPKTSLDALLVKKVTKNESTERASSVVPVGWDDPQEDWWMSVGPKRFLCDWKRFLTRLYSSTSSSSNLGCRYLTDDRVSKCDARCFSTEFHTPSVLMSSREHSRQTGMEI